MSIWQPPTLYEERLRAGRRSWWWLLVISVVTLFTISVYVIPIAILAWFVNIGRYARTRIRVDSERIWVGNRSIRLSALDLDHVGRATNPWPWRVFSPRYLGGNPFWTHDSVGIHGAEGPKKCWVSVGTNHRDELLEVLRDAARAATERRATAVAAYAGRPLPTPGWYDDPWDPARIRWWDGEQWSGYAASQPSGRQGAP